MNISVTLIAQTVVFILLVWFTMKYVWPPLAKILDERAATIAAGLAAAQQGKSDLREAEAQAAAALAAGRQQIDRMLAAAEKRAAGIIDAAAVTAKAEAAKITAQAAENIGQELNQAKEELRAEVAQLALLGAEKILRREINAENHSDLLAALKREL